MENLLRDLRYGLRTLRRNPAFSVVALLTLILGIGANTAVFTVVNAVLLRPLPYPDAERIVRIWGEFERLDLPPLTAAEGEFYDYRDHNGGVFSSVGAWVSSAANLTGEGDPERISVAYTANGFFETLGVKPMLGRVYGPEENRPDGVEVLVLSHGLWQRRFGGDREVIGKRVEVNGDPLPVLGVMPPGFDLPAGTDLWSPVMLNPAREAPRGQRYLHLAARLAPGVSLERAQGELAALARRFAEEDPASYPDDSGWTVRLVTFLDEVVGDSRTALLVLFSAVALVLLIACVNVVSLLLARAQARQRELAMRLALGASRGHLIRQSTVEIVLLSLAGGALGLLLADRAVAAFLRVNPQAVPRFDEVGLDARVMLFTFGLSLATGIALTLLTALRATRPNLGGTLKEGGKSTSSAGQQRFRRVLVGLEVATALVLLVGAGLMIRSVERLQTIELGFEPDNVLSFQVSLARSKYGELPQMALVFDRLLDRLSALPGVESASSVSLLPLGGHGNQSGGIGLEGEPFTPGDMLVEPEWRGIDHRYFETMGTPLLVGRDFRASDDAQAPPVAIIDQPLARRLWPGEEAIGKRIKRGPPIEQNPNPWMTVVGVVGEVKQLGLTDPARGVLYSPQLQWPRRTQYLVVRTAGEPLTMVDSIRAELRAFDPDQPISDVKTMDDRLARVLAAPRFAMLLLLVFAGLALVLAAVGIYGVVAYSVAQRTQEIGVRMALGSNRLEVFGLIVRQGMSVVLLGLVGGLIAAFWAGRAMRSLLYGVETFDPAIFAGVTLLLIVVALLAHLIPARRAARLEPTQALRYE